MEQIKQDDRSYIEVVGEAEYREPAEAFVATITLELGR